MYKLMQRKQTYFQENHTEEQKFDQLQQVIYHGHLNLRQNSIFVLYF